MSILTGRLRPTLLLLLLVPALVAGGCRSSDTSGGQQGGTGGGQEGGQIATGEGVTEEPCPDAVNSDNGCIYLGTISDLTEGPFAALAVPITDAQEAFWRRVNEAGGIGGYDINVTEFVRDNKYNPQTHNQVYQEIKGDVLALAQTLGSPTTAAIIEDLDASDIVAVPASWTSAWLFRDVILESGASYCIESMNAIDYAVEERQARSVMAVHFDGDYGDDGAAGAQIAAEANGLSFTSVEQTPKQLGGTTTAAVDAIVGQQPDVVILTLAPTETGEIVGNAVARGYRGLFIGTSPTWNPGLLQSSAAEAIRRSYLQSSPWPTFTADTPGHQAMREALSDVQPNDGYTSGWIWSYPLKAALEQAAEAGDLTRQGLLDAVTQLSDVDYEGTLPAGAGVFSGAPNDQAFRQNIIHRPDDASSTGLSMVRDFFVGPTAEAFEFGDVPCFQQVEV